MISKRLSEVTDAEFSRLLDRDAAVREVMAHVQKIVGDVRENGDTAVMQYTLEYDKADIVGLRVTEDELLSAYENASQDVIDALYHLSDNITSFHTRQVHSDLWLHEVAPGVVFGQKTTPLDRIGAYVPGGFAVYPSTALMNIVPLRGRLQTPQGHTHRYDQAGLSFVQRRRREPPREATSHYAPAVCGTR